ERASSIALAMGSVQHGKLIVQALDEIGFLSKRLIAAHSVWLEDAEIEILAKKGVSVAHCLE
ncbi:amidohydrolase family protein, partial [Klebsiella aerogenes]|uniref:amidohydrolase family protein n=1 Tax=Klebsiella aerogenes TaxID=548 RepID=UPI0019536308